MFPSRSNLLLVAACLLTACGSKSTTSPPAPAKAEAVAHESDLLRLTLTREAQVRLGITTVRAGTSSASVTRATSGEIVVPAGAGGVPTNSMSNLQQLGIQQVAADGEAARTRAQLRLARIAFDRAAALVREEAGSLRARDEAAAALAAAKAAADAARAQRRLLGPSIRSLADQSTLWVRVPVFGSDVGAVERGRAAMIRPLGDTGAARAARPVQAPPSANAVAGTVDLYFALDNRDRAYRVGQRVGVTLPIASGTNDGLSLPTSAIVRDIYGGEWVYAKTAPGAFIRQRIEVASTQGDRAILSRGLTPGAEVVTAGAAELFGTEFGVAH
ncbi:MAG: membrane fusion protein MtrC [Sphingomonas sp. 28-62-20]|nr:MAG: membrane fusion protein MtrC [Sphingomonas sp. 28-62-20]